MLNRKLYVVHGMGNDSIGLVERIAAPIAAVNGNILDLRQDVLHGLFTIYLVADLSEADITQGEFTRLTEKISDETGLRLIVDKYVPVPRPPKKVNLLLILLGHDRPGIIAAISEALKRYSINIEFSQMIGREGVFLMELLADISQCTLPVENLKQVLRETMEKMNITTMFQDRDVFNKKKRIIVFDYSRSMMRGDDIREVMSLTGITPEELAGAYPAGKDYAAMKKSASLLDGLPEELAASIVSATGFRQTTLELFQTLKTMGYRIVLSTSAFSFFTEYLRESLDISYAGGCAITINDDRRVLTSEIDESFAAPGYRDSFVKEVMAKEGVADEDVTRISDVPGGEFETPGMGVNISIKTILDYYNQHIISRDNVIGLLGCFGPPVL